MKRLLVCHYKDFFAGSIHDFELISSSSDINDAKEKFVKKVGKEKRTWKLLEILEKKKYIRNTLFSNLEHY